MAGVRVRQTVLYLRLTEDEKLAVSQAAKHRGLSVTEFARRAVLRATAASDANAQAEAVAESVRSALLQELGPLRRLAYFAAREAAKTAFTTEHLVGITAVLTGRKRADADQLRRETARRAVTYAMDALRRPLHPDPEEDAALAEAGLDDAEEDEGAGGDGT